MTPMFADRRWPAAARGLPRRSTPTRWAPK